MASEERMLVWFGYDDLPTHLHGIARHFHTMALVIDGAIAPGSERTVAFRKLLESREAAIRAVLRPGG